MALDRSLRRRRSEEIENIREFFRLNKYIWDEDSGVLSNGSESCIFSYLGPFSLFKENDSGDVFPDVVFNYIISLSDKKQLTRESVANLLDRFKKILESDMDALIACVAEITAR